MMVEKIPVEGHQNFYRDGDSGAIVNSSTSEYETYLSLKKIKEEESKKATTMEEDLANLKGEINEIKSLLKELVSHGK